MAPAPTYDPPHVQLGRLMVLARRRGLSFEEWWEEAVRPDLPLVMVTTENPPAGAVRWPSDYDDRTTWRDAILDARDGWRRAYEREQPKRCERALLDAASLLGLAAAAADALADLEAEEAEADEHADIAALMAA